MTSDKVAPPHKLTEEQVAKIEEILVPQLFETERGRPKLAPLYDEGIKKKGQPIRFYRNEEAFEVFLYVISVLKEGISYRKAAEYMQTYTGKKYTYEALRKAYKQIESHYPEWEERRSRNVRNSGSKNARSKEVEDLKARKKHVEKSAVKRQITLLSRKYAEMQAEDKVAKGELPEDALEDPTKYQKEDGSMMSAPEAEIVQAEEKQKIVFKPNEGPQTDFLASNEREVLYGGAAGGGKSYALIADPVRYFSNKNFNGILLRRTNDELRELIWKTQEMYPEIYPGAKWSERKSQWTFPSGARLWMTFLDRDEDVLRYQGQAFTWIGFDELTQHPTPFAFNYMRSRLRTTDPSLPLCMRATTNPGGPGHGWVKKMFVDPAPANTRFCPRDLETGAELRFPVGHAKEGEPLFYRRFIPATLMDNPYLSKDGVYEANLLSLPEQQRKQLLEGDWMVADGAAFPEFSQKMHVTEPFEIPDTWMKFRSCDFGYTTYSAVHWYAVDPAFETLYVYRELYLSKHTAKQLARAILEAEQGEKIMYGVLDSSTWHKRGHTGPSIAEEMIQEGCRWRPADRTAGSRVAGKNRLHELLREDEHTEMPGIIFFNNCRQIIADMQVIPSCPKGSDDIDVRYASDHAYDSVRYGIMTRPRSKSIFDFGDGLSRTTWTPKDPVFGY